MTIQELHIGLELGLQQLNSNLYNRLENEGKDFILNLAINDYVNGFLSIPQSKDNIVSFNSIRDYYSSIYSLLKTYYAPVTSRGSNYIYSVLPEGNEYNEDNLITSGGYLYNDIKYKVVSNTGSSDLSKYGGSVSTAVGDTFTSNLGYASLDGNGHLLFEKYGEIYLVENSIPLTLTIETNIYRQNFSPLHLQYNIVHPQETYYPRYKRVKAIVPTGLTLIPYNDTNYLDIIRIDAMVDTDNIITTGYTVEKGKYYKLTSFVGNTYPNLSAIGGYSAHALDVIFNCTKTTSLLNSSVMLTETKFVPVRILKNQDVQTILKNTYGLSSDSLISEIKDNGIYTYHNDETYINYIDVVYVKTPCKVNLQYNITSDLNSKVHSDILNLAIGTTISKYAAKNMAASGQFPQSTQQQ